LNALPAPADLVPQAGGMCLLDGIRDWDGERVSCVSASHRRADHPLRRAGNLRAIHLLEYAAQASAVHGALAGRGEGGRAAAKYLAAARDFELHVTRLDDVRADLRIDVERLLSMGDGVIYGFRVSAGDRLLAEGRLSVAAPSGPPT
jgi:predicted hotdog family 3-hydroxylacyl-ACP dehydratase